MQVALIAEFEVAAKDLSKFLSAAKRELNAVRKNESGCLRFDVIILDQDEGRGAFVEVFADQAAADLHRTLPHFRAFFDAIETLDVQWTTRRGTAIN